MYKGQIYLDEQLKAYAAADYYPFHMPGHKRKAFDFENPYKIDITEIEGFDNLHQAEGILLQSQERLSRLYGSKKAYYLVNGSTCGLLSAVGALITPGNSILMARNCHKSIYNAVKIFRLKTKYVYPEFMTCGIQGAITPENVEDVLKKHTNINVVIITSPTYDGIVSDINKIAEIVHKYNAYLIIDEAHGAHFSMNPHFPESAIHQGADVVVQSLHKTLPSFTQTAALHVASERVDCTRIEEMLGIFETSSPSYILMAGIEHCIRLLEESGSELFEDYYKKLERFYLKSRTLKHLRVLTDKDYGLKTGTNVDISKLIISTLHTNINGEMLYRKLLDKYHLQMEMYSAQYVLAMTSIMDTEEGFFRLIQALQEIDEELSFQEMENFTFKENKSFLQKIYAEREKVLEIADIENKDLDNTDVLYCEGKICAEYIYLYPPGIPMIVPGEVITHDLIKILDKCRQMHLCVQGTKDKQYRKILTVAQ